MTRRVSRTIQRLSIVIIVPLTFYLSCKPRTAPPPDEDIGDAHTSFFDQPVHFCVQKSPEPESGDVQVLIDGSGSMVGFDARLPDIVKWSQHAVSAIQNSSLKIRNSRICTFRETEGITGCTGMTGQVPILKSRGNTNLHEAINSAKDYSLTFIVTDGVAATGDKGKGDCATGVDASCVARSFVDSIHSVESNDDGGVWIVPLVAPYDGLFFTEEAISPSSFRSEDAIQKVRSDIAVDASIQNPKSDPSGKLVFNYKGPRSLLLIVLANKTEVGRAAIQALWQRADYLNVKPLGELQNYSGGIAALTPVEIYPGFLNKIRWENLKESDEPDALRGTIDAQIVKREESTSIEVNCPNTGENSGSYTLTGSGKPDQLAGCVPLRMMPGFTYALQPTRSQDGTDLQQFIRKFKLQFQHNPALDLNLTCPGTSMRRCSQNPIPIQLVAFMHYGATADSFASAPKPGSTATVITSLSTAHPSIEPHKITALSLILELFYRGIGTDARRVVLNSFDLCKK